MNENLQEHLAENPPDFHEESWRIDGFETANWAMRKLKAAQARLDAINRQALDEAAKISDWANLVSKAPLRDKAYFENALKDYLARIRESEGTKSLVLPDGEVTSRSIPDKAAVQDRDLFLKWAANNAREGWIRVKEEVALDVLKDEVDFDGESVIDKVTGEIIEGLVRVVSDISVTVKVTK